MKKTVFLIVIVLAMLFSMTATAAEPIKLIVDGECIVTDVDPVVINNRTLVPLRSIFEKLGATVEWINIKQQAVVRTSNTNIILAVGDSRAHVNEKIYELDTPPVIINSRTFVPVRFISEILGYIVEWDGANNAVVINSTPANAGGSQINRVSFTSKDNTSIVTVDMKTFVTPKVSREHNPTRFVMDFPNTVINGGDAKITGNGSGVTEVRYAQHPNFARVVIETSPDAKFDIKYTGTSVIVSVQCEMSIDIEAFLSRFQPTYPMPSYTINGDPLIVIDAGHGGKDTGAIGYDSNGVKAVLEKNANLAIAKSVYKYLTAQGVRVIMTRTEDTGFADTQKEDLLARCSIANDANADLFVSIHNNSFTNSKATGTEILYVSGGSANRFGITGEALAENVLTPLVQTTGIANRGLKDSPKIVVLKETKMPAILIECAFVSNPTDRLLLTYDNPLDNIGGAIASGILKTLSQIK